MYEINQTPTGFTIVVDGKLRGSHIKTHKEAEHQAKLLTDEDYAFTFKRIQQDPAYAIEAVRKSWRLKEPAYYAHEARSVHYHLSGRTQPLKGVGLTESALTWEGAENRYGEVWHDELYRSLAALLKDLRKVEDAEAITLVTQMGHALRHNDRDTYYKNLDRLMYYYGDIW